MTLKTQMTSDLSAFFNADEFAESVTYNPTGGAPSSITAMLERDDPNQEPYVRGDSAHAVLWVKASEVANPQQGDTFTIGTETWELDPGPGMLEMDDNVLVLAIRRVD